MFDLGEDRAGGYDVEIPEVVGVVQAEVVVTHVATSVNGHGTIGDEGFIMHSSVHRPVVAEEVGGLSELTVSNAAWVVEADVEIRVLADGGEVFIVGIEPDIVDQQPDPDTALACFDEAIEDEGSTMVVCPEECLDVDRTGGGIDQGQTPHHGFMSIVDE